MTPVRRLIGSIGTLAKDSQRIEFHNHVFNGVRPKNPSIRVRAIHPNKIIKLTAALLRAHRELECATIRLEILTGRMRGCHEETGKHELIEEAEAFCSEAREALEAISEIRRIERVKT